MKVNYLFTIKHFIKPFLNKNKSQSEWELSISKSKFNKDVPNTKDNPSQYLENDYLILGDYNL